MENFSSSETPPLPPPPLSWPLFPCAFTDNLMECVHGSVERVPPAVLPSSEDLFMALLLMCLEEYLRIRISSNLAEAVKHDNTSMSDEMDELLTEIDKFRMENSEDDEFTRSDEKDCSLSKNPSRRLQKLMENYENTSELDFIYNT